MNDTTMELLKDFKMTEIGLVPEEWEVKKVENVLTLKGGSTPSTNNDKYWGGQIYWAVPTDITKLKSKYIINTGRMITKDGLLNCSATLLPTGSILLTSRATIGFLAINKTEMATNQGFINILPSKEISNIFLYYYLNYIKDKFVLQASGSTFLELSKNVFGTFRILLPPLPEQHQIAVILSTIDSAIEQTEAIIAKQQRIKTGLMQDLLTRGIDEHGNIRSEGTHEFKDSPLGRVPEGWEVTTISSVAEIRGRVGWKGYTVADLRDSGPLTIGAAQISKENELDLSCPTHLSEEKYYESPEIAVSLGDVLVVQRGSTIGKVVLIDRDIGPATINPSMILLTDLKVSPAFLYAVLCSHLFQKQLADSIGSTGVPMISQKQLSSMLVQKMETHEQKMISSSLNTIAGRIHAERQHLAKLHRTKTALMQDLLTGKVRVTPLLTEPQEAGA